MTEDICVEVLKLTADLSSSAIRGEDLEETGRRAKAVEGEGQGSVGGEPSAAKKTVSLRKTCTKKSEGREP